MPIDDTPTPSVATVYTRWSVQYDTDANTTRDLDAEILRQSGLDLHNRDVLELGCGTGKNTEWLATHARHVTALDFSDGMLSVARRRITSPNTQFVQHDVREPWPVAANSVDVIVGNLVLEHVEHLASVYVQASRVLRPGGQLYFCELHPFRQLRGGQAHFTEQSSGEQIHVAAFVHSVSDYINPAIECGFTLQHVGECLESTAPDGMPPRLLSVQFTNAKLS